MDKEREKRMLIEASILLNSPLDILPKEYRDNIEDFGYVRGTFICGVRWEDRNPESPWVQINERMPEDSLPDLSNTDRHRKRIKTILLMKDGRIMEGYRWMTNDGTWYWNIPICMRDEITHWMPIPPVPPIIDDLT